MRMRSTSAMSVRTPLSSQRRSVELFKHLDLETIISLQAEWAHTMVICASEFGLHTTMNIHSNVLFCTGHWCRLHDESRSGSQAGWAIRWDWVPEADLWCSNKLLLFSAAYIYLAICHLKTKGISIFSLLTFITVGNPWVAEPNQRHICCGGNGQQP